VPPWWWCRSARLGYPLRRDNTFHLVTSVSEMATNGGPHRTFSPVFPGGIPRMRFAETASA
jgi:hypothetical protein